MSEEGVSLVDSSSIVSLKHVPPVPHARHVDVHLLHLLSWTDPFELATLDEGFGGPPSDLLLDGERGGRASFGGGSFAPVGSSRVPQRPQRLGLLVDCHLLKLVELKQGENGELSKFQVRVWSVRAGQESCKARERQGRRVGERDAADRSRKLKL